MSDARAKPAGESLSHPAARSNAGPRVLLIGTAQSVAQVHPLLTLGSAPLGRVVGCVLPEHAVKAASPPVPILGHLGDLPRLLASVAVDLVLVTLPVAMGRETRAVLRQLEQSGRPWRFMPTLADQLAGRIHVNLPATLSNAPEGSVTDSDDASLALQLDPGFGAGEVDPVTLLNRTPRPLDEQSIRDTVTGKVVLITGAGGSIGSELARSVCRFAPARLILIERSENALFEIDRQIARLFPDVARAAILHDVTDAHRTMAILALQRPHLVFHAAAHKHVPMMEDHPAQAVENNFYGTRSIADASAQVGVERFVMISTDKAVNPSSVMGATKRLAELYVQYLNELHAARKPGTIFSMVRFGNVLGSACSVLPIWRQQLADRGPITVTHPQMQRYFMTIPEAAGLVIQAAVYAQGGEVFLLDMGEPIRILDLAERFVRTHGLEPHVDVEIRITGIRPGEKLLEELAYDSEDMLPTPHEAIRLWRSSPPNAVTMRQHITRFDALRRKLDARGDHWEQAGREEILTALRAAVPDLKAAIIPSLPPGTTITAAAG